MKPPLRPAVVRAALCLIPLALAACQGEKKTPEAATAQGEILPGSASDAMLPYDTLQSKPPLAPPPTEAAGKGGKGTASGAAAAAGEEEAGTASEAPAPAAAPSIAAEPVQ
ncbi:hypothetical protein [Novosphingobium sp. JCM 18896]|uniref:hypothetical protein n=1 Tax=Novosphingobium sp. JCM 18896 TaxID=2989731 RepID=UPI002222825A|nr:hypothetical protein [Novosphingobium sp. JCM 18896]MCW1428686.1 hypothetical protein [Novosphingobium sp. JCM 18896]